MYLEANPSTDEDRPSRPTIEERAAQLEREKLNGKKKVSGANYKEEKSAYDLMIPPYEKEIYVITMIKIKIKSHCEEQAADAGGAAV